MVCYYRDYNYRISCNACLLVVRALHNTYYTMVQGVRQIRSNAVEVDHNPTAYVRCYRHRYNDNDFSQRCVLWRLLSNYLSVVQQNGPRYALLLTNHVSDTVSVDLQNVITNSKIDPSIFTSSGESSNRVEPVCNSRIKNPLGRQMLPASAPCVP